MTELKPLPPREAIDAFAAKGYALAPSFSWKDRFQEDHAAGFTVAKAMSADVLQTIHDGIADALAEGKTLRQFRAELEPKLAAAGWWGQKPMTDPKTGETRLVQLGSPRRLKLIFDVNVRQAHAAGQWARMQRVKGARPYVLYSALLDERTRPEHRAWHGTVVHIDDPWLETHTPMNGWRCRCAIRQLSAREVQRRGLRVVKPPPGRTRRWTNDRTGITYEVPEGIDPGFASNPGRAALHHNAARIFAEKSAAWSPGIGAAATAASARVVTNAQGAEFRGWLDDLAAGRKTGRGDARVIGALDAPTLEALAARGVSPRSGAIVIKDDRLTHMTRETKRAPIPAETIRSLPELMAKPRAILRDRRDGDLLYVLDVEGSTARKLVIRLDLRQKAQTPVGRARFTANAVRTAGDVDVARLRSSQYEVVTGSLD